MNKLTKAQTLGIKIIDENELRAMCNEQGTKSDEITLALGD